MKPVVLDQSLYERARAIVNARYKKPSAYRSAATQKLYKEMGGRYGGHREQGALTRWIKELWADVNPKKAPGSYPLFRPTRRVSSQTPLTVDEVNPANLLTQAKLKQKIRGSKNLPPFKGMEVL